MAKMHNQIKQIKSDPGSLKIGFLYADPIQDTAAPVTYYDEITKVINQVDNQVRRVANFRKKKVKIRSLPATTDNLVRMIKEFKVDILHISCHGSPDYLTWETGIDDKS